MFDLKRIPLPNYSPAEDRLNSISHALGVPMYLVGAFFLLRLQSGRASGVQIFSTVIYLLSTLLVFATSAVYHGLKPGFKKQIARVLDHSNIYLMISGNVTAFYLAHVYSAAPKLSVGLIVLVWALSAVGILLTFMDLKKFNIPQIFMYVLLGWIAVFGMRSVNAGSDADRAFLYAVILGGICITVGAVVYFVGKKLRYFHAVFHLFVLAGNWVIFLGTYRYYNTIL